MGKFVIVFKKKYPKFKLGDHINLIFKEGVNGGDTIKINGKTVPLLYRYRNGFTTTVDSGQFTVGNKYVGEWTSKGLEIYAGEFVKEEKPDPTKKTIYISKRGTDNWYPCLFTQFKIEKQSGGDEVNRLIRDTSYTIRVAKSVITSRDFSGNTFAMLKYGDRVIPFLDRERNYITTETLLSIMNKNTTGYDINYATIQASYRVYFNRDSRVLDGIEIEVPSSAGTHTRYRDYPVFNATLNDPYKYFLTKSTFVKNRLYAIPASYAGTADMHGNFKLNNDRLTFIDKFGKNWTDFKDTTTTNISKLLVFGDENNKVGITKDFELCIPSRPNDGLFKTVSGDLALFCLPGLYDFTTSINIKTNGSIIDPLKYINEAPYGVLYRMHMDELDSEYVHRVKANSTKVDKYSEWILPHFMAIYKMMDNAVNDAPYSFKTAMLYNGRNISQVSNNFSTYKTINILARNKTAAECANIVNSLAANIKKYKYKSIIRLIADNKVPYETIRDALLDADEYALYTRERITKEEALLIKYLPASIADDRNTVIERLRTNNTDVLFPNIKNLNDFGMVQDCLDIRPNHYFLYDLESSRILDENSLYTVSFNGPTLDGVKYYIANDISDPQDTWTEIDRSSTLTGLRGKSIIVVFKNADLRYRTYNATVSIKDDVYNINRSNTDQTPDGVVTYRIIPQSGIVINTNVNNASDSSDNKWSLYIPGSKLSGFSTATLIVADGNNTTRTPITGDGNILVSPNSKYKLELVIGNYKVNGTFTFGVDDQTINSVTGNTTWVSDLYTMTKAFDKVKIDLTHEELLKDGEMIITSHNEFTDTDNLFDLYSISKMGGTATSFTNESQYKMVVSSNTIQAKNNGHAIVGIYFNGKIIPMVDGSRQYIRTTDLLAYQTSLGTDVKIPMTYKVLYQDANVTIDVFEINYQSSYRRDKFTEDTVYLVGCNRADYAPKYKYFKGNVLYAHKKLNPCNPTPNNNEFFYKNEPNPQCQIDMVNKTATISARYYSDFTTPLLNASHVVATIGKGATDINLNLDLGSPIIKCAIESTSNNCNATPYDLYGIGTMKGFQALYHTSGRVYMYRRSMMKDNMLWSYILNVDDYVNAMNGVTAVATTDRISLNAPAFKYVFRRQDFKDGTYKESFTKIMGKLANLNMDNKNVQVYISNVDYMQDILNITAEELMELSKPAWNGTGNKVNLFITSFDDLDDTNISLPSSSTDSNVVNFTAQANETKYTRQRSTTDANIPDILEITGGSVWFDKKELLTELFKPDDIITIICTRELRDSDIQGVSDIDILNMTFKKEISTPVTSYQLFTLQGSPVGFYKINRNSNSQIGADKSRMCNIGLDDKYIIPIIDKTGHNYISVQLMNELLLSTDVYLEIRRFVPENPAIKYPIYGAILLNNITDAQMIKSNSLYYSKGDNTSVGNRTDNIRTSNYLVAVNTVPGTNNVISSNTLIADLNYRKNDVLPAIPVSGNNKLTYRTGEYIFNANLTNSLLSEDSAFETSINSVAISQFARIRLARNYGVNQINTFELFLDNLHMRYTDSKNYKDISNVGIGTFFRTVPSSTQELAPQSGVNNNTNDPIAGTGKNTYIAVPEMFEPNLEYTNEPGSAEWKQAFSTKLYKNGIVYDFFTHSCDIMYADTRSYADMNLKHRILNGDNKSREGINGYPLISQVILIPHFDGIVHFYKQFLDDTVTIPTSISIGKSPVNVFVNRNSDTNHKNYVIYLDEIDDMNANVNYITSFITKYYSQLRDDESVSIIVNNYASTSSSSNNYNDNVLSKRASLNELNNYISRINKVLKQEITANPSKNLKISVHFTNSRYQVMGPWSNEYISSTVNTVTANNATGLEIDRIAKIVQASTGNTSVRNIFDGFNLTLNFLRKADFMQARNSKAFVGFKDPVIFESL